jgi:hypothetical protein
LNVSHLGSEHTLEHFSKYKAKTSVAADTRNILPGNTKGGSITVPLTSCSTGSD